MFLVSYVYRQFNTVISLQHRNLIDPTRTAAPLTVNHPNHIYHVPGLPAPTPPNDIWICHTGTELYHLVHRTTSLPPSWLLRCI